MENNFVVLENVSYGSHERHIIDIYIPKSVTAPKGFMLFIHGGGWHDGDKDKHFDDCEYFSSKGYLCGTMNYRFVSEELTIFDELDDITLALKKVKAVCAEYGYNIDGVLLSGVSAGGHLSLMYAYTRMDTAPVKPVAVCAYCPPPNCAKPDFLIGIADKFVEWKHEILSKCCGYRVTKENLLSDQSQGALMKISPENYVCAQCVPTAVFYGKYDELVPVGHIEFFLELLEKNGVVHQGLLFENSNHSLKDDPEAKAESMNIIDAYAKRYF